jgi:hypothetical protein
MCQVALQTVHFRWLGPRELAVAVCGLGIGAPALQLALRGVSGSELNEMLRGLAGLLALAFGIFSVSLLTRAWR